MVGHMLRLLMVAALLSWAGSASTDQRFITVASTTSTANSGLFDHILPIFEEETGIQVRVVAVGTGQAIRIAQNGDADVLLVHHTPSEEAFVADGYGTARFNVMYNDFVIVGPVEDPAGVSGSADVTEALASIARTEAAFASRGDDSGTHRRELALWQTADIQTDGDWYRVLGSGMGATLNTAHGMGAYTLSDRATWLSFENKDGFAILFEGDESLFNQYGIIAVDPSRFPHVRDEDAMVFVRWFLSEAGQTAIASYRLDGAQLFFPNAD